MGLFSSLAGAALGGAFDMYAGKQQQQASAKEAARNRAFQERMSSTAHQREVEDLRKAGLNPILSATRGASTPGGSTGSMSQIQTNSARAGLLAAEQIRNIKADTKLKGEQANQAAEIARQAGTNADLNSAKATIQREIDNIYRHVIDGVKGYISTSDFGGNSAKSLQRQDKKPKIKVDFVGKSKGLAGHKGFQRAKKEWTGR